MVNMRFTRAVIGLLLAATPCVVFASFERDVLQLRTRQAVPRIVLNESNEHSERQLRSALLSRAVPLAEYESKLKERGLTTVGGDQQDFSSSSSSITSTTAADFRALANAADDFSVNDDAMFSFTGYAIKYAKCQPVQYFSENAILAGEHSPMVTEDIVILRLCPYKTCSATATYGCYYNYAEYAIALSDYLGIMLRWANKKKEDTCAWCALCLDNSNNRQRRKQRQQRRKLEDANGDDAAAMDQAAGDDAAAAAAAAGDDAPHDDAANAQDDDASGDDAASSSATTDDYGATACSEWSSYCSGYKSMCLTTDDTYLDYAGYEKYLDCAQVKYNDHAYFIRARCDGSTGAIKMAVYYDNYCIQYAGNDVSIKDLGLGFRDGFFKDFYSSTCIDCSESSDPPNFDTTSTLCNLLHYSSAKCTTEMMYDIFASENDQDYLVECSYIESLRFGAYDENGQFSSKASSTNSWTAEVSMDQKISIGVAVGVCICFIIYSCYLHHSMTNLLIKSLSHRELLPPSRSSRRSPGRSRSGSRSSSRRTMALTDEPDWDSIPMKDTHTLT